MLIDEAHLFLENSGDFNRIRMRNTFVSDWPIGEKYNDRFETEVGGSQIVVTQSVTADGDIQGTLPSSMSMDEFAALPKIKRQPCIVDYSDGQRYSIEQAERIEEFAPVLKRLNERIAQYNVKFPD